MISNALRQANLRLAKAEAALVALRQATTFEATEVAWTDFLMACSTIYSKLEQGSKSSGKSTAWYGRIKSVRKRDQLLRYIHHARDSDHHGIEDLLAKVESQYKVTMPSDHPMWFIEGMTLDPGSTMTSMSASDGINPPVNIIPTRHDISGLKTVTNTMYGDSFTPPEEHLGKPLVDKSPISVAELTIVYLKQILIEASTYADHSAP